MAENKSFGELTVNELKAVAEQFAVDLDGITKKADIIKEIEANGVTFDFYESLLDQKEEEVSDTGYFDNEPVDPEAVLDPTDEVEEASVVLKMTRKNWTYEVRGYKFTQQHPYALVSEDDADYLIEVDGGFRMASPKELREFYGA